MTVLLCDWSVFSPSFKHVPQVRLLVSVCVCVWGWNSVRSWSSCVCCLSPRRTRTHTHSHEKEQWEQQCHFSQLSHRGLPANTALCVFPQWRHFLRCYNGKIKGHGETVRLREGSYIVERAERLCLLLHVNCVQKRL